MTREGLRFRLGVGVGGRGRGRENMSVTGRIESLGGARKKVGFCRRIRNDWGISNRG